MDFSLTRLPPRFVIACTLSLLAIVGSAGSGIAFVIIAVLLFAGTLVFDIASFVGQRRSKSDTTSIGISLFRVASGGLVGLAAASGLSIFHGLVTSYIIVVLSHEILLAAAVALGGKASRTWTSMLFRYALLIAIIAASLEGMWSTATQAATGAQLALTPLAVLAVGHAILRFTLALGKKIGLLWIRIGAPLVSMLGFATIVTWLTLDNFVLTNPTAEFDRETNVSIRAVSGSPTGVSAETSNAAFVGENAMPAAPDESWINATLDPSPLTLGPVLGAAGPDSIRIWIATEAAFSARVVVKTMGGEPVFQAPVATTADRDFTGWVQVGNLKARTQYVYDIIDERGQSIVPSQLREWCSFITFPTPGTDTPLRYMVASCHRPLEESADYFSGAFLPERFVMWEALSRQHKTQPMDFMLLLGDQAYNDMPFLKNLPDEAEWQKLSSDAAYKTLRSKQIRKDFRDNYVKYWSHPSMRKTMAAIPSFMIWDDHETRDGWGSMPEDSYDPKVLWLAAIAAEVDTSFQGAANPNTYEDKRYFNFDFGTTSFFIPDLRSYRKEYAAIGTDPLMGAEQWKDLDAWFAGPATKAKTIFLGLSVPMADAPGWVIDWLSQDRSGLGDDFRDKWYYKQNREEMVRLLDRLFAWQKNGERAFTLGGDSHIALLGRLSDRSLPVGAPGREVYELTASGISNQDTTAQVSYFLFKTFFGKTWMGDTFQSQVLKIVNNLNYGVVEVLPPGTGNPGGIPAPAHTRETRFWVAEELVRSKATKLGLSGSSPDLVGYHLFMTSAGAESAVLPSDSFLALPR